MNANYEKIKPTPGGGMKFRTIAALGLFIFVCGAVAAGWVMTKYDLFQPSIATDNIGNANNAVVTANQPDSQNADTPDAVSNSVKSVTDQNRPDQNRPGQNQQNEIAPNIIDQNGGNFNNGFNNGPSQSNQEGRTEAMLVAFAARRAMDKGAPLDYVENPLLSLFGRSNPKEVAIIVEASEKPVRLSVLQNQLETATEILLSQDNDASQWEKFKQEMRTLFVIRKAGTQPAQPERRLARIKIALAERDVQTAVAEMKEMPGAAKAQKWIDLANRYILIQNALDSIEKTAIGLPVNRVQNNPVRPTDNGQNIQTQGFQNNNLNNGLNNNPFQDQNLSIDYQYDDEVRLIG